ncbi:aspartate aminotransferase family protein [Phytoactinopolyspora endophytica]|uniref:aminotransferase family protein n=1 Tax=Phytoactinopolyspora endophytica TaxID=1642495 RepID=UPI00197BE995|nr:aminotransferase class III-fold pyridoxal phosphate-dependent enzyme [Phytoactinopolyspora endophytica]
MVLPDVLHPFAKPSNSEFLTIVEGDGAVVRDADGREYIDAMASLWYCNVGHGRTEIIDAVGAQLRVLDAFHTFDIFTNAPSEELARELSALAPGDGFRVFYTGSGSESVDSAIKLARAAHARAGNPDRRLIVSRVPSYHGVTYGGLSATGLPANQEHFGPLVDDVVQVPYDDAHAVERIAHERPGELAAVIAEPVVGAAGVYPPPPGYLNELRRICDEHGSLLILDEVICGFGRLGRWWGAEHYGVRPDLVTFAKGVTSGYIPLGGVLVGPAIREPLEADPDFILRHGHTYSGHPVACAAGLAALGIMRDENLPDRAPVIGQQLSAGLQDLADRGLVAEARGAGAMWAAGMHPRVSAVAVRDAMLRHGVIARAIGDATVSFCPPLITSASQIDTCIEALEAALEDVRTA